MFIEKNNDFNAIKYKNGLQQNITVVLYITKDTTLSLRFFKYIVAETFFNEK